MAKRFIKGVEWVDERLMGHSLAYREGGRVFVEVHVCGSVLLNDVEYILDEVVTVAVENKRLSGDSPTWTIRPTIHSLVIESARVEESHRRQGHFHRFLDVVCADPGFDMVVVEAVQNPILAEAFLRWDWECDSGIMDFYKRKPSAPRRGQWGYSMIYDELEAFFLNHDDLIFEQIAYAKTLARALGIAWLAIDKAKIQCGVEDLHKVVRKIRGRTW